VSQFVPSYPDGLPIGDGWVAASHAAPVHFPYDGTVVATAPVGTVAHARMALDAATRIAADVAALPSRTRRDVLLAARDLVEAARTDFESLLVLETGKPLRDCKVEVARTLVTLTAASEEVARIHGETVPLDLLPAGDGMFGFWRRVPIGVVVGIAGFNYPLLLAAHKIAPSIAAGCPVVCKPAPHTPLATLWLVDLIRGAAALHGAPTAMVQLVTGDAAVGAALVEDDRVGAVSFTGSSAVGHAIARAAAPRKVLLELGSNAALIVAADADLARAADAVVRGGYYASGQACISVQRVIVEEAVATEFLDLLVARAHEVVVGDPRDAATDMSALIDERSTERVQAWVSRAVDAGARIVAGGRADGRLLSPTVVTDVPAGLELWDEEVFGPVVAVRVVPDIDAAFAVANDSRYGLHASVWTRSLDTAFRAIDRLEVGGVIVNEVPGFRSDTMPYGGVKDSGTGREGPRFAIEELTVTKMAVLKLGV
jgi:acyl-CoA reductase-like NAD-dependent aldehyde dehydrogenase